MNEETLLVVFGASVSDRFDFRFYRSFQVARWNIFICYQDNVPLKNLFLSPGFEILSANEQMRSFWNSSQLQSFVQKIEQIYTCKYCKLGLSSFTSCLEVHRLKFNIMITGFERKAGILYLSVSMPFYISRS